MAVNVATYIKNLGVSVAYATVDQIDSTMPAMAAVKEQNQDLYKTIYKSIIDYKVTTQRVSDMIIGSKVFKAADTGIRNVKEDITSGKFYNKDRINKSEEDAAMSMFNDGDDDDAFNFDDNFEDDFNDDTTDTVVEKAVKNSAEMTSMTIAKSAECVIENQRSISSMEYVQNVSLVKSLQNSLVDLGNNTASALNVTTEILKTHAENSKQFYESTTAILVEQNTMIKSLVTMMEESNKKPAEKEAKESTNRFDDITSEGMPDISKYMKVVTNNMKNAIPFYDTLFGGAMGDGMLESLVSSPLQFIPEMIAKVIVPGSLGIAMKRFDQSLSGIFGAIIARMTSYQKSDNPLFSTIGKIFGINNSLKNTINTGNYEKGAVPFDGVTRKSIVETIPGYLRRIESALTGRSEKIYDFENGKWVEAEKIKKDFESMKTSSVRSGSGDVGDEMRGMLSKVKLSDKRKQDTVSKDFEKIFTKIFEDGGQFDPYGRVTGEDADNMYSEYGVEELSYKLFLNMWEAIPKSKRNTLARDMVSARGSHSKRIENLEKEGNSIFSLLFNGDDFNAGVKKNEYDDVIESFGVLGDSLTKSKDSFGNTVFDYLHSIADNIRNMASSLGVSSKGSVGTSDIGGSSTYGYNTTKLNKKTNKDKYNEEVDKYNEHWKDLDDEKNIKVDVYGEESEIDKTKLRFIQLQQKQNDAELKEFSGRDTSFSFTGSEVGKSEKERERMAKLKNGSLVERLLAAENIGERAKVITDSLYNISSKPAEMLGSVLGKADERIYDFMFGKEVKDERDAKGNKIKGFFNHMILKVNNTFTTMLNYFKEHILQPIKQNFEDLMEGIAKKLGYEDFNAMKDDLKRRLFDEDEGIFGGVSKAIKGNFKEAFNQIKDAFKFTGKEAKDVLDDAMGVEKDEEEEVDKEEPVNDEIKNKLEEVNKKKTELIEGFNKQENHTEKEKLAHDEQIALLDTEIQKQIFKNKLLASGLVIDKILITKLDKAKTPKQLEYAMEKCTEAIEEGVKNKNYTFIDENKIKNHKSKKTSVDYILNKINEQKKSAYAVLDEGIKATDKVNDIKKEKITLERAKKQAEEQHRAILDNAGSSIEIKTSTKSILDVVNEIANNIKDTVKSVIDIRDIIVFKSKSKEEQKILREKYNNEVSIFEKDTDSKFSPDIIKTLHRNKKKMDKEDLPIFNKNIVDMVEGAKSKVDQIKDSARKAGIVDEDSAIDKFKDMISSKVEGLIDENANGARMIKKSGITTISKGEMVIPSDMNPFNPDRDKVNRAKEIKNEKKIKEEFARKFAKNAIRMNAVGDDVDFDDTSTSVPVSGGEDANISDIDINKASESQINKLANSMAKQQMALDKKNGREVKPFKEYYEKALATIKKNSKPRSYTESLGKSDFAQVGSEAINRIFGSKADSKTFAETLSEVSEKAHVIVPDAIGKGLVGGTIGLLSGVLGGPLIGAGVGIATAVISKSEQAQKWLFGDKIYDEDGNDTGSRTGGLFSAEIQATVKKYFPDMKRYGIVGSVLGLVGPMGPIGGLLMGSTIGYIKNNERVREAMFGDDGLLSKDRRDAIKKAFPSIAAGTLAGLFAGPFGILGNAVIGSAVGYATTTDGFKDLVLGELNEDTGEREGGIVGTLKDSIVDPIKDAVIDLKDRAIDFITDKMIKPITDAMKPLSKQFSIMVKGIGSAIIGGITAFMNKTVLNPLGNMIKEKIIDPLGGAIKKVLGIPIKIIGGVLSAPSRLIGAAGNLARKSQIKRGQADYMSAEERLEFRATNRMGFGARKENRKWTGFDKRLQNMSAENVNEVIDSLSLMDKSERSLDKDKRKIQREGFNSINKYFDDMGISGKARTKILSGFNRGENVSKLITKYASKNGKRLDKDERATLIDQMASLRTELSSVDAQKKKLKEFKSSDDKDFVALAQNFGLDVKDLKNKKSRQKVLDLLKGERRNRVGFNNDELNEQLNENPLNKRMLEINTNIDNKLGSILTLFPKLILEGASMSEEEKKKLMGELRHNTKDGYFDLGMTMSANYYMKKQKKDAKTDETMITKGTITDRIKRYISQGKRKKNLSSWVPSVFPTVKFDDINSFINTIADDDAKYELIETAAENNHTIGGTAILNRFKTKYILRFTTIVKYTDIPDYIDKADEGEAIDRVVNLTDRQWEHIKKYIKVFGVFSFDRNSIKDMLDWKPSRKQSIDYNLTGGIGKSIGKTRSKVDSALFSTRKAFSGVGDILHGRLIKGTSKIVSGAAGTVLNTGLAAGSAALGVAGLAGVGTKTVHAGLSTGKRVLGNVFDKSQNVDKQQKKLTELGFFGEGKNQINRKTIEKLGKIKTNALIKKLKDNKITPDMVEKFTMLGNRIDYVLKDSTPDVKTAANGGKFGNDVLSVVSKGELIGDEQDIFKMIYDSLEENANGRRAKKKKKKSNKSKTKVDNNLVAESEDISKERFAKEIDKLKELGFYGDDKNQVNLTTMVKLGKKKVNALIRKLDGLTPEDVEEIRILVGNRFDVVKKSTDSENNEKVGLPAISGQKSNDDIIDEVSAISDKKKNIKEKSTSLVVSTPFGLKMFKKDNRGSITEEDSKLNAETNEKEKEDKEEKKGFFAKITGVGDWIKNFFADDNKPKKHSFRKMLLGVLGFVGLPLIVGILKEDILPALANFKEKVLYPFYEDRIRPFYEEKIAPLYEDRIKPFFTDTVAPFLEEHLGGLWETIKHGFNWITGKTEDGGLVGVVARSAANFKAWVFDEEPYTGHGLGPTADRLIEYLSTRYASGLEVIIGNAIPFIAEMIGKYLPTFLLHTGMGIVNGLGSLISKDTSEMSDNERNEYLIGSVNATGETIRGAEDILPTSNIDSVFKPGSLGINVPVDSKWKKHVKGLENSTDFETAMPNITPLSTSGSSSSSSSDTDDSIADRMKEEYKKQELANQGYSEEEIDNIIASGSQPTTAGSLTQYSKATDSDGNRGVVVKSKVDGYVLYCMQNDLEPDPEELERLKKLDEKEGRTLKDGLLEGLIKSYLGYSTKPIILFGKVLDGGLWIAQHLTSLFPLVSNSIKTIRYAGSAFGSALEAANKKSLKPFIDNKHVQKAMGNPNKVAKKAEEIAAKEIKKAEEKAAKEAAKNADVVDDMSEVIDDIDDVTDATGDLAGKATKPFSGAASAADDIVDEVFEVNGVTFVKKDGVMHISDPVSGKTVSFEDFVKQHSGAASAADDVAGATSEFTSKATKATSGTSDAAKTMNTVDEAVDAADDVADLGKAATKADDIVDTAVEIIDGVEYATSNSGVMVPIKNIVGEGAENLAAGAAKATSGVVDAVDDVIDAVDDAGDVVKNLTKNNSLLSRFLAKLSELIPDFLKSGPINTAFKKMFAFLGKPANMLDELALNLAKQLGDGLLTMIGKIFGEGAEAIIKKYSTKILGWLGPQAVLKIIEGAASFLWGWNHADVYLEVKDPTIVECAIAGIINAINQVFLLGIIDTATLYDWAIGIFKTLKEEWFDDLVKRQEALTDELMLYNSTASEVLTKEEYLNKDKVVDNALKAVGEKASDAFGWVKEKMTAVESDNSAMSQFVKSSPLYGMYKAVDTVASFLGFGGSSDEESTEDVEGYADGATLVEKTGLATVSKGEMIIPADMNPFNNGKISRAASRIAESNVVNEYRKNNPIKAVTTNLSNILNKYNVGNTNESLPGKDGIISNTGNKFIDMVTEGAGIVGSELHTLLNIGDKAAGKISGMLGIDWNKLKSTSSDILNIGVKAGNKISEMLGIGDSIGIGNKFIDMVTEGAGIVGSELHTLLNIGDKAAGKISGMLGIDWNKLKSTSSDILSLGTKAGNKISEMLGLSDSIGIGDKLIDMVTEGAGIVGDEISKILNLGDKVVDKVTDILSSGWNKLKSIGGKVIDKTTNIVGSGWNKLKSIGGNILNIGEDTVDKVTETIGVDLASDTNPLNQMLNKLVGGADQTGNDSTDISEEYLNNLQDAFVISAKDLDLVNQASAGKIAVFSDAYNTYNGNKDILGTPGEYINRIVTGLNKTVHGLFLGLTQSFAKLVPAMKSYFKIFYTLINDIGTDTTEFTKELNNAMSIHVENINKINESAATSNTSSTSLAGLKKATLISASLINNSTKNKSTIQKELKNITSTSINSKINSIIGFGPGPGIYDSQTDNRLRDIRFNSSSDTVKQTIGDSGCAPVVASNLINTLAGAKVTDSVDMAKNAIAGGYKEPNSGVRPDYFNDSLNKYGIRSETISNKTIINDRINRGIPTVLLGKSANNGPYSRAGHYVLATGKDSNGNILVQDPRSSNIVKRNKRSLLSGAQVAITPTGHGVSPVGFGEYISIDNILNKPIRALNKFGESITRPILTTTSSSSTKSTSATDLTYKGSLSNGQYVTLPSGLGKYFTYMGWQMITSPSSQQYKLREKAGMKFNSEGFGIINNRYVVAVTTTFGRVGDYIDVQQSNGRIFPCIIGDIKSQGDPGCTKWGHNNGSVVLEFVVDKSSWYNPKHANPGTAGCHPEWGGQTIVKISNVGSYFNTGSGTGVGRVNNYLPLDNERRINRVTQKVITSNKPLPRSRPLTGKGVLTGGDPIGQTIDDLNNPTPVPSGSIGINLAPSAGGLKNAGKSNTTPTPVNTTQGFRESEQKAKISKRLKDFYNVKDTNIINEVWKSFYIPYAYPKYLACNNSNLGNIEKVLGQKFKKDYGYNPNYASVRVITETEFDKINKYPSTEKMKSIEHAVFVINNKAITYHMVAEDIYQKNIKKMNYHNPTDALGDALDAAQDTEGSMDEGSMDEEVIAEEQPVVEEQKTGIVAGILGALQGIAKATGAYKLYEKLFTGTTSETVSSVSSTDSTTTTASSSSNNGSTAASGETIADYLMRTLKAQNPDGTNLSSHYGDVRDDGVHYALDIGMGGKSGVKVYSPISGTVISNRTQRGAGWTIGIKDANGYIHSLMHLASKAPKEIGQEVKVGDEIGTVGGTTASVAGGPAKEHYRKHVHWQIAKTSQWDPNVDPEKITAGDKPTIISGSGMGVNIEPSPNMIKGKREIGGPTTPDPSEYVDKYVQLIQIVIELLTKIMNNTSAITRLCNILEQSESPTIKQVASDIKSTTTGQGSSIDFNKLKSKLRDSSRNVGDNLGTYTIDKDVQYIVNAMKQLVTE